MPIRTSIIHNILNKMLSKILRRQEMSGFIGINQFGSLTVNGQKLKFEDFDKDKNGEISKEEYDSVLKEMQLDSVELSNVDKNGDNVVSEEEFAVWEQKTQMQDAVNGMAGTISRDFAGKTQYLPDITNALKDYIEDFAKNYTEETSKMAEDFKASLPEKYNQLKASVLSNDPDTTKSQVLDEIYSELISKDSTKAETGIPETAAKRIAKELEAEADKFMKTYTGTNLAGDLKAHLEAYMNKSDAEKLKSAAEKFKADANSFGAMIDNGAELKQLKEFAKEFLTAALDAGVTIKLGGITIKTTNAITTALAKFTDGEELKSAVEEAIAGLDTSTVKEKLVLEEGAKAAEAENKKFSSIKGKEYAVDASTINLSTIPGYFDNSSISIKKKKKRAELKDNIKQQLFERLETSLKPQMKEQIRQMLEAKGIPFEKIEQVFENIYNSSFIQTFDADGMVSSEHKTAFRKGTASVNVKQFVDQFITTFNTNIENAINQMNKSDKDFDTVDLNMSVLGTDGNGSKIETANNDDILRSYQTGKPLTTKKHGADYYIKIAEQIIDGLKAQMMAKARAMCTANGVKFDVSKFNAMFDNAKGIAVNSAVTGSGRQSANAGAIAGGSAGVAVGGTTAGVSAAAASSIAATVAAGGGEITGIAATVLGTGISASAIPVVGWVAGGAAILAAGLMAIFGGGHHSSSTLDTRGLVDGFTQQFSEQFSNWVETEKNEAKKK